MINRTRRTAISNDAIRESLKDLMQAVRISTLADCQDGGVNVDVILSQRTGHTHQVMSIAEAERIILDKAIRSTWELLTGTKVKGDPVEFIEGPV